ncbi:hypothetical protein GT755_10995 [Herbidospora sp. NEAU-GS84]|uniref:Tissue inhibitor of metalloproteinase n=1 Tax=Herbidospora solisilvae TaxID=2696284 RepID=A0A7C9N0H4_9ACTN|nr:hypothetical protein [Herbidospora solisilvae]NAS22209.1 hypothetical protein [Herbidospora solisilvae]
MWRRLLLVLALAAGTLVFSSVPAYACKCALTPVKERVQNSAVVFTGVATGFKAAGSPVRQHVYTFRADHAYKGKPKATVKVATNTESAACGVKFARGARYLVFAYKSDGRLVTGSCSGNTRVAKGTGPLKAADLPTGVDPATIKQLGKAKPVRQPPQAA